MKQMPPLTILARDNPSLLYVRERHLVFRAPDVEWACAEAQADQTAPDDAFVKAPCEDSFSYTFLALRMPVGLLDDYLVPPGLSLLDGMLYSSTSLDIVEF